MSSPPALQVCQPPGVEVDPEGSEEIKKKEHIQPIIDQLADLLSGWKADLLIRAGRKIHVQFVLTATIIYLTMALDLPQWAHKAIDKIQMSYY
jgi:hypothetical protein